MSPLTTPVRLLYIDDSGAEATGFIVYSWIETTLNDCWRGGLRGWLDLRKDLYVRYRIPPAAELHAAPLLGGHGRPSLDSAVNSSKQARNEVMELALATIGSATDFRVGTVYRETTARGAAYGRERSVVYEAFIHHLDARLELADEWGMAIMDGNGSDKGYDSAHRALKLATRRVIEDPLFQSSHRSQWVQMADLVAWTAYQSLLRAPNKKFAWDWYDQHLRAADVNGGPVLL